MKSKQANQSNSRLIYFFTGLIATLLIAFTHYVFYPSLSVSIFFVIPVLLISYFSGFRGGLALAILSAALLWLAEWDLLRFSDQPGNVSIGGYTGPTLQALFHLGVLVFTALVMSGYRLLNRRFDEKSMMDPLTGLYNRHGFYEIAKQELHQDIRYGHPLSIACFDITNLKKVNEDQGEGVGNMLLQTVARTAKKTLRSSDIVARIGSDEFIVLFSESDEASLTGARKLQEKLQKILQRNNWPVELSMGHVTFNRAPESVDKLIRKGMEMLTKARNTSPGSIEHESVNFPSIQS